MVNLHWTFLYYRIGMSMLICNIYCVVNYTYVCSYPFVSPVFCCAFGFMDTFLCFVSVQWIKTASWEHTCTPSDVYVVYVWMSVDMSIHLKVTYVLIYTPQYWCCCPSVYCLWFWFIFSQLTTATRLNPNIFASLCTCFVGLGD